MLKSWLLGLDAHFWVLIGGNVALAGITGLSYYLSRKGLGADTGQGFVRMVYAATVSKLFLCMIGILSYVLATRPQVSKETIFILMFLYLVYTVFETLSLHKLTRRKKI
ncbi:hypothetical protein KTO58_01675 [Chitinophaga pendula]|uniref:hypothetical protein n=1 Tax=Chitinophaga TaxID=79328 RepID=UPI0012FD70AC|nr:MULTISPECIES: hypothetical protein [Chitinophaga]UCJ07914.1 hypothetical protein KTO58_01675 [Chitinophaga pendula]